MLGFSTFTETPFGQADSGGGAIAGLSTQLIQKGIGSVTVIAEASVVLTSVVSSTNVTNIVVDASSQINLSTLSISTGINSLGVAASTTLSSQVSTFSNSSLTLDAQASTSIASIVSSFANSNIDIQANAGITIDSIVSTLTEESLILSGSANTNTSSLLLSAFPDINTYFEYSITVANPGSGNKYYVDSVLQQQLYLQEGQTYRFDQSASSNANHPLKFSTTSNGTHASGSEYTTGVVYVGTPGNAGAYTEITVAAGAPKLYYYCANHSGMGGTAYSPAAGTVSLAITVSGASGSNKYYIDGAGPAPTISLTEGTTYRLDQSDSSNGGHPLRFSTTPNGTHSSGSEYVTGVTTFGNPGSSEAYTEITVAANAPTLYYYCTNHSGMGGQFNTLTFSSTSEVVVVASIRATITLNSLLSETNNTALEVQSTANVIAPSILLSSGLTDFADEDAEAVITLTSVSGILTNVLNSPTSVQFPYQNFANDYSRQRTLFIISPDKNNTVHIPADPVNRTVFIQSTASSAGNRTVKIAA